MNILKVIFLTAFVEFLTLTTASSIAKDEEIEVKLQFLEYELEDFCMLKNEAEWKFLNGTKADIQKVLEVEIKEAEFYKNELEVLQRHIGKNMHSEKLQRLIDIFSHPGAPLLGNVEFKEYREYSVRLQEIGGSLKLCLNDFNSNDIENVTNHKEANNEVKCDSITYNKINKLLFTEKDDKKLKNIWIKWYRELEKKNKKMKYDFVQQLTILDLEAEQNGEEELPDYWVKTSDTTWVDYDKARNLWEEIVPLYNKLKHLLMSLISQKFGKDIFNDQTLIPVHVLGSLNSGDWVTAAENLEVFNHLDIYKEIKSFFNKKNTKELYKVADNLTSELKIGTLPQNFYEKSRFNESSEKCKNKITNYCEKDNMIRAMSCNDQIHNLDNFLNINENTMRIKYLLLCGLEEEENGYLFREGHRDSALYEAIESFSSLIAMWPKNLHKQKIITVRNHSKAEIFGLLVNALHIIPIMPYYLATDLWRIKALQEIDKTFGENTSDKITSTIVTNTDNFLDLNKREIDGYNEDLPLNTTSFTEFGDGDAVKTYDTKNLTIEWWKFRRQLQGINSPDGDLYEDYLQDQNIIWNRPYLSKFLGKILQFQILHYCKQNNFDIEKINFEALMKKGKSKSWETLAREAFNITEITVKPLLDYFKPLENFLDNGIKFKNETRIFNIDNFNYESQGYSLDHTNIEKKSKNSVEGSDTLIFSLAVIAAIGLVAVIVTIGRRRYKKKKRTRERKRRLTTI